jgi:arabinofuranosyltransferase
MYKHAKIIGAATIALLIICAFSVLDLLPSLGYPHDDAFISFRYAHNLILGDGLVFNPGERVEGYSNFLWTLFAAGAIALNLSPYAVAVIISALAFLALLVILIMIMLSLVDKEERQKVQLWALTAMLTVPLTIFASQGFTASRFIDYIASGLESVFFTLLFTLAVFWENLRGKWWGLSIVLALISLTRADGYILCLIVLIAYAIEAIIDRKNPRRLLLTALVFAAIFLPYFIWRVLYYGDFFPNSYYAKTAFGWLQLRAGLKYTCGFIYSIAFWIPLAILGITNCRLRRSLWVTIMTALYVIAVGGDWMHPEFRFYFPLIPILALTIFSALEMLFRRWKTGFYLLAPALMVLLLLFWGKDIYLNLSGQPISASMELKGCCRVWQEVGEYIRDNCTEDEGFAINPAGIVPYYAERYCIDMTGLNDKHIGHLRHGLHRNWDADYILAKEPHYIVIWSVTTDGIRSLPWDGEATLYNHPEFATKYSLEKEYPFSRDAHTVFTLELWKQKPVLEP